MTKTQARVVALRLAYNALHKAHEAGGEEEADYDAQAKIDDALDALAQAAYERWAKAKEKEEARERLTR